MRRDSSAPNGCRSLRERIRIASKPGSSLLLPIRWGEGLRMGVLRVNSFLYIALAIFIACGSLPAQTVTIDAGISARHQTIDGFGTCLSGNEGQQSWWRNM